MLAASLHQDAHTDPSKFPRLNWQPTEAQPGSHYLGSETCLACHPDKGASPPTPMTRAMELGSRCEILRNHLSLTFRDGPYIYRITRNAAGIPSYSVSDGKESITEPIEWAFGQGEAGQTYVIRHNGDIYETRVSFFADVQNLDITIGYPRTTPSSLEEAIGHKQASDSARVCFGCHSTAAVKARQLDLDHLTPGVTCEGCHFAGGEHVAAVQRGDKDPHIFNPGKLNPGDLADFCGSCHRSGLQVVLMHSEGINTVRFQPYRLSNSRCYDPDDRRISCIACHDPHQTVRREASFYDSKCLACHGLKAEGTKGARGEEAKPGETESRSLTSTIAAQTAAAHSEGTTPKTCPVAKRDCITCHMPKYELPGGHFKFTDHMIRIARPGAPFVN